MSLTGIRVLVVEDEAIVAMLAEDILLDQGAVVIGPAASVARAMELIETEAIDIGFLDVNINGERSHGIAARLRDQGVPFVFATGYDSPGMVLPDGARLIHKPYRADQITAALTVALSRAKPLIPDA